MTAERGDWLAAMIAARATLADAAMLKLSVLEHRTLEAVVAHTALYSRYSDRVWLAQLAAFAYGVDEALPWQNDKVSKALARLARHGLIERRAPLGRPPREGERRGPAYFVGLTRSRVDEAIHEAYESRKSSAESRPDPVGKSARIQPEKRAGIGCPTEVTTDVRTEGESRPESRPLSVAVGSGTNHNPDRLRIPAEAIEAAPEGIAQTRARLKRGAA